MTQRCALSLGFAIWAVLVAGGCEDSHAPVPTLPAPPDPTDLDAGVVCEEPDTGCPCEGDEEPLDCYAPAQPAGGNRFVCGLGTRVCRDGAWSACERIETYTIRAPKELGATTGCGNPCNPECSTQTTTPDDADLTPDHCADVIFDYVRSGVTVESTPAAPVTLPDADGDGYPDVIDECPSDAGELLAPCDGSTSVTTEGFAFSLPLGTTGTGSYPPIELQLSTVDYYVLMDTTGSMAEEIAQLRTDLTTGNKFPGGTVPAGCAVGTHPGVLGAINCRLPDTAFGVGSIREYPVEWDSAGLDDTPYHHLLDPTTSFASVQQMVNALSTNSSASDWPEATSQALYSIGSGLGLGPWTPGRESCSNGGFGYPCFRPGSIPVILVITDAPMQGGPQASKYPYSVGDFGTPDNPDVPAANLDQPPVVTVDEAGWTVQQRAAAATAAQRVFDLGDLTNEAVTVSGTTYGSPLTTNDVLSSTACSGTGPRAPLFKFTLSSARTIRIDTFGSEFDTNLALLNSAGTGLVGASGTYCNDNRANSIALRDPRSGGTTYLYPKASYLRFVDLPAGTYHIHLDGESGGKGQFQLRVRDEGAPSSLVTSATTPRSWASTVAALNSIGAKTIGIAVCGGASGTAAAQCSDTQANLRELGTQTGSVDAANEPFVYLANADGTGLSGTVVTATMELANHLTRDVSVECVDNPSTPSVDECAVFDFDAIPDGGQCPVTCAAAGNPANTCLDCAPGSDLSFGIFVTNEGIAPTDVPQVFTFDVRVVADGVTELSRVPVRVVVPPVAPAEPGEGWFEMTYDAGARCDVPDMRADWGALEYTVDVPVGSRIAIELRTAATEGALASATPVVVEASSGTGSLDIGQALVDGGQSNHQIYLGVRFHLYSSASGAVAPLLQSFRTTYDCVYYE